jgi:hypothetical protein
VRHLFFECCVAQNIWEMISDMLDFESIVRLWLNDKKYKFVNILNAVVLWSLWKTRNNMCFQVSQWRGTRRILAMCASSLRSWCLLLQEPGVLEQWARELEGRSARLLRITWTGKQQRRSVARGTGREAESDQASSPDDCVGASVLNGENNVLSALQDGVLFNCSVAPDDGRMPFM